MTPPDAWEVVAETLNGLHVATDRTGRLRVPGGWLYRNVKEVIGEESTADVMALVFGPDQGTASPNP